MSKPNKGFNPFLDLFGMGHSRASQDQRYQKVTVEEPTVEQSVRILRRLRTRLEKQFGVNISESALVAAASLSARYMTDKHLPSKAITLLDSAAAQAKLDSSTKAEAIALENEIQHLTWDEKSLSGRAQDDRTAAAHLADIRRVKALAMDKLATLKAPASDVGKQSAENNVEGADKQDQRPLLTEQHVSKAVSSITGVPVSALDGEEAKLLSLADELHKRIIGQNKAVTAVAEAIQRSRVDLADPNRPIASVMFLGPTGVGKTELAKTLATYLHNTERAMIRLDMSEYSDRHTVSRLIGSPPGYIGYGEGGQLTEAVRKQPYSVVLFDELEKAHDQIFPLLLQVLDDGRLTDGEGRTVCCKNTIIIMTSNVGSSEILEHMSKPPETGPDPRTTEMLAMLHVQRVQTLVMEQLKSRFRPEFLNRLDEFIVFEPFTPDQVKQIVKRRAKDLSDRLTARGMQIKLSKCAVDQLARVGFDPLFGARPIKRALQRELQTPLAQALLRKEFKEGDTINVKAARNEPGHPNDGRRGLILMKGAEQSSS